MLIESQVGTLSLDRKGWWAVVNGKSYAIVNPGSDWDPFVNGAKAAFVVGYSIAEFIEFVSPVSPYYAG